MSNTAAPTAEVEPTTGVDFDPEPIYVDLSSEDSEIESSIEELREIGMRAVEMANVLSFYLADREAGYEAAVAKEEARYSRWRRTPSSPPPHEKAPRLDCRGPSRRSSLRGPWRFR